MTTAKTMGPPWSAMPEPAHHTYRCAMCGKSAKSHVEHSEGCGNFCGTHVRSLTRKGGKEGPLANGVCVVCGRCAVEGVTKYDLRYGGRSFFCMEHRNNVYDKR